MTVKLILIRGRRTNKWERFITIATLSFQNFRLNLTNRLCRLISGQSSFCCDYIDCDFREWAIRHSDERHSWNETFLNC